MAMLILEICMGTSCHLLGTEDLLAVVENLPQEVKAKIELRGVTCLKTCRKGPNVRINGVVLSDMTPDRLLDTIYDNLPLDKEKENDAI